MAERGELDQGNPHGHLQLAQALRDRGAKDEAHAPAETTAHPLQAAEARKLLAKLGQ